MINYQDNTPYRNCLLCPRRCGVNREALGQAPGPLPAGLCGETAALKLAFAGLHMGEEPPIAGYGGSGTIFISGCNLGCSFCQNYQISREGMGREVSAGEFAQICLALRDRGAENINLVTGSHAAPALALGLEGALNQGLNIPVVWNSSAYESIESLELLKDYIDIYLPDLKTLDKDFAERHFKAPDYPLRAKEAILKMMEYRNLKFAPGKQLISGLMVRHLVVPGHLDTTREVLSWFAHNCKGGALLSLMTQYTPVYGGQGRGEVPGRSKIPGRYVSESEYAAVMAMLEEFGLSEGFCQELVTGSDWLPDFNLENPFSSKLSQLVWHWKKGFV